ncbi:MAG: alanine racemase [Rubrivivax sp.]|nr:alanine racemase [Rubrivivax sp.]
MPRPIEAVVHPAALAHNLGVARAHAQGARVWAVVKANAYGHGIERAFEGLRGADGFALLDLAEASALRTLGWRGPVLLLEGCFEPRDLELCSRLNLWHVVHQSEQIDWLAAHKTQQPHRVFLKMNSGMNRLGFATASTRSAYARLAALPQVDEISLMTHFSDADGARGIAHQIALFDSTTADLPGERSLSNSAALLRHGADAGAGAVRNDWVRAGILSYGSAPDYPEHDSLHWGLQPTMTLRTRVIATQMLQPGDTVGYGSAYRAERSMRIGIAACGYADGYPRHAGSGAPVLVAQQHGAPVLVTQQHGAPVLVTQQHGAPVLVDGQRSTTVGRVSMDMLALDLSAPALMSSGIGSEVVLWGRAANGAVLTIDEVARAAATIGYELMCAVAPRVPIHADTAASA